MSRIRINELARELEVKPSLILEVLPKVGVTEKKTHSSSVEDEQAQRIRKYFGRISNDDSTASEATQPTSVTTDTLPPPTNAPLSDGSLPVSPVAAPGNVAPANKGTSATGVAPGTDEAKGAPAVTGSALSPAEIPLPRVKPQPLRPPLAGQKAPAIPVAPFVAPVAAPPPAEPLPAAPGRAMAARPPPPTPTP